ncbi:hypothetical protein F2Q70_00007793 [Brassica cretica]|uniref:Uncharacterized protein n=1 Tax=Brassica cretica TaxID=69181 RepID=A0A8S9M0S2_BRACR|nr:hypothetical protein F2Q70_00007793 [Brassica cretica]
MLLSISNPLGTWFGITTSSFLFVPGLKENVLSLDQLTARGYTARMEPPKKCTFDDRTGVVFGEHVWDERGPALRLNVVEVCCFNPLIRWSLSADTFSAGLAFTSGYMFSCLLSPLITTTRTAALSANPTLSSPRWFLSMEEACLPLLHPLTPRNKTQSPQ